MNRFTVILKSGKEFSFDALEADLTYKMTTEEIARIRWYGASGIIPLYINPAEVAVIYYEEPNENDGGDTVT